MTIVEIAREAHVSIATVDRVLHARGRVSEQTKERILAIAKAGDYRPNLFARNLRKGGSLKIGVLLVDYHKRPFPEYWELVEAGCRKAMEDIDSLPVSVGIRYYDSLKPGDLLASGRSFLTEGIDGLVFPPILLDDSRMLVEELGPLPFAIFDTCCPFAKAAVDTAQDPFVAGRTAGRVMQLFCEGDDDICVMYNKTPAHNIKGRLLGFLDYFHTGTPPMILAIDEGKDEKSQIRDFFTNHMVRGVFVLHSASQLLVEVLDEMKMDPYPRIIGFDDIHANRKLMQAGKIDCIISQDPFGQGYRTVRQLALLMAVSGTSSTSHRTPVTILLRENLDSFPL